MSNLRHFIVVYDEPPDADWQFFKCQAEDGDHAEEQCMNSYPECGIVGIYPGENLFDAMRGMEKEYGHD